VGGVKVRWGWAGFFVLCIVSNAQVFGPSLFAILTVLGISWLLRLAEHHSGRHW
jgi:hypothetical protein